MHNCSSRWYVHQSTGAITIRGLQTTVLPITFTVWCDTSVLQNIVSALYIVVTIKWKRYLVSGKTEIFLLSFKHEAYFNYATNHYDTAGWCL